MYAAGRIPGSFFRREGRPGTDAILTCRLIDRPLRPSFVDGLRNEIQIVVTVMSLNPQDPYDVVAINAASASTQLAGLPFSGPIGGVRVALIDGTWVAFPTYEQLRAGRVRHGRRRPGRRLRGHRRRRDHDGGGRGHHRDDQAGRRRRAGAHRGRRRVRPGGREAVHPHACAWPSSSWPTSRPSRPRSYPTYPAYQPDVFEAVSATATDDLAQALTIGGKQEREARLDEVKAGRAGEGGPAVRGPREGDRRRVPVAEQEAGPPPDPHRPDPHRRPRASPTSGRCRPRSRSSRGRTARRCSSAARPRSWASPR